MVVAAAAAAVIQLTVPVNVLGIVRGSAWGRRSRFLAMMGTHRCISAQLLRWYQSLSFV